jgi:hypothetical protein
MAKAFSASVISQSYTPNQSCFRVKVIRVPIKGTPVQLPDIPIPDGIDVVIKAKTNNGAKRIYIANSSANTAIEDERAELRAGEAIGLQICNTNFVWIDASANDAAIELIMEA